MSLHQVFLMATALAITTALLSSACGVVLLFIGAYVYFDPPPVEKEPWQRQQWKLWGAVSRTLQEVVVCCELEDPRFD